MIPNPVGISTEIHDGPYGGLILLECVENSVREYPAEKPVVISVDEPMSAA